MWWCRRCRYSSKQLLPPRNTLPCPASLNPPTLKLCFPMAACCRQHCARGLGAAVLGDERYGSSSSGGGGGSRDADKTLFLHCRSLEVHRPGARLPGRRAVEVTAPLPPAWRALLRDQGWPLPREGVAPA